MSARKWKCPACNKPAVPPDTTDDRGRWCWTEGVKGPCPHCGVVLRVDVTDDYSDDAVATLSVVKAAAPPADTDRSKPVRPVGNTGGPPPIFVAWTENLRPNTNPLDRINLIVERTAYAAGLSLHHEVEESGPEIGKPALVNVIHPVTRYVPAPVVAAEGRYAVVYQTATMPHAKMEPHVFLSRAQVDEWLAWNKHRADGVVRILPDGAHEAALAAAREEGRISGLAALRERMLVEGDVLAWGSAGEGFSEYEEGVSWALGLLDKALKEAAS